MTAAGWVMMILSVSFVVALVSFCFYRVLSGPRKHDLTEPRNHVGD